MDINTEIKTLYAKGAYNQLCDKVISLYKDDLSPIEKARFETEMIKEINDTHSQYFKMDDYDLSAFSVKYSSKILRFINNRDGTNILPF